MAMVACRHETHLPACSALLVRVINGDPERLDPPVVEGYVASPLQSGLVKLVVVLAEMDGSETQAVGKKRKELWGAEVDPVRRLPAGPGLWSWRRP